MPKTVQSPNGCHRELLDAVGQELGPLAGLADIRVICCLAPAATEHDRIARRVAGDPHRSAHGDRKLLAAIAEGRHSIDSFVPISLDVPTLTVDTGDGCRPGLPEIVALAESREPGTAPDFRLCARGAARVSDAPFQ